MRKQGQLATEIEVQVPFHDVDLAGIVWHGHYLKYLENARWALMDRLGFGLDAMLNSGFGWPIVDLQVKYLRASRYAGRLRVRASLIDWENQLTINYLLAEAVSGQRVARAQTRQVAVEASTGLMQLTAPPLFVECVRAALSRAGAGAPPEAL